MVHKSLSLGALCLFLGACGSSIEGVYSGQDTGFLDQIEIKDDQKVELMFMGTVKEGTYEIEDDRVKINNGGEITILRIEEGGCLDGGALIGRYCKGQAKSASVVSAPNAATSDSFVLVGGQFAAGPAGDEWTLEFLDDSVVRMMIGGESENLRYETDGNEVIISGLDGDELALVRRGVDLEGGSDGIVMLFKRR